MTGQPASQSLGERVLLKDNKLRPGFRVLVYIIATTVATVLLSALIGLTSPSPGGGETISPSAMLAFEACLTVCAFAVAFLFRRFLDQRSIASLGFSVRGPWLRLLSIGCGLGVAMQLFVFALEDLLGYSHFAAFATARQDAAVLTVLLPTFALLGLAEEMLFRGYILQNIWEAWGPIAAVALTSALFAVAHLGNPGSHAQLAFTLIGLVAYALWACISLLWTKSLWLAVGVHFMWNVFEGPVLGFPVSGFAFPSTAIRQTFTGPHWFTGGPFGPEAGASAVLALAFGYVLLSLLKRQGAFADVADEREPYAR